MVTLSAASKKDISRPSLGAKYFQNFDNQVKKYKNALTQKTHIHVYIPVWVLIK